MGEHDSTVTDSGAGWMQLVSYTRIQFTTQLNVMHFKPLHIYNTYYHIMLYYAYYVYARVQSQSPTAIHILIFSFGA